MLPSGRSTPFSVVLSYDQGSGLTIERGGELVQKWQGADLQRQMREPLQAVQWINRYLIYLGNLRKVSTSEKTPNVAVIVRSVDQIVPAEGEGFEHGSMTSMLRAWSCDSPFADLPFTSLLIADNLNDVEPLIASAAQTVRTRVPLPDAQALERALGILRKQSPRAFAADASLPTSSSRPGGAAITARSTVPASSMASRLQAISGLPATSTIAFGVSAPRRPPAPAAARRAVAKAR